MYLRSTFCECAESGYCHRHKRDKSQEDFERCASNKDSFIRWEIESGYIKGPGLIQKSVNLTVDTAKYVTDGMINVNDTEYKRRLQICKECPFFTAAESCLKCGCPMKLKAKRRSGTCPDDPPRW